MARCSDADSEFLGSDARSKRRIALLRAQLRLGQPVGDDARQRRSREQLGDRQRQRAEDAGDHRREEEEDQQRERLPHRVEPREGGPKLVDPDPRDQ